MATFTGAPRRKPLSFCALRLTLFDGFLAHLLCSFEKLTGCIPQLVDCGIRKQGSATPDWTTSSAVTLLSALPSSLSSLRPPIFDDVREGVHRRFLDQIWHLRLPGTSRREAKTLNRINEPILGFKNESEIYNWVHITGFWDIGI
jgi:hypothetical protein